MWNYRMIVKGKGDEALCAIHEVFYDDDDVSVINGWTEQAVPPEAQTPVLLKEEMQYYLEALDLPALTIVVDESGRETLVEI